MRIKNASVFGPEGRFVKQDVCVEEGRFVDHCQDTQELEADGCLLIPGLIDIHFHGCAGYDFCDATRESLSRIAAFELTHGVTSICPASMTLPEETLTEICKNAVTFRNEWKPGGTARLCGINLEGPFISTEKKGAQNPAYVKAPDAEMFQRLLDVSDGLVKLTTIAPEEEHAMEFIRQFKDVVRISLGHTSCGYGTALQAFRMGAAHMTHLYNAMPPFSHRDTGPVGAGFESSHVTPEIICDGIHVARTAVRAAFTLFGDERMILISDSMMATGMPDGKYALGGLEVFVRGNRAVLKDDTLAGSVTNLMDCMRTAVREMEIPLESAIKAATINPARAIGVDKETGSIETGKYADFLLLDQDTLEIRSVFSQGIRVAGPAA